MADHIGIVACSAPGAALCYETICTQACDRMGSHAHPEISLHGHSFAEYVRLIDAGDWSGIGHLLVSSATKLASIGAKFVICPDNTVHQAMDTIEAESPIPWLHIAEVVAQEALRVSAKRVRVLGTRYLMEGPVYPEKLHAVGLQWCVPRREDRDVINRIIFQELVFGRVTNDARRELRRIINELHVAEACDTVVLGCTELPLAVTREISELPMLDSTRLLARAAILRSLEGNKV
jgi:aspartate racemase